MLLVDLAELEIPSTIKMDFPDPADILNFNVTITPDEGKVLLMKIL
jgi:ubiquitin-conjugating enzyme E2 M